MFERFGNEVLKVIRATGNTVGDSRPLGEALAATQIVEIQPVSSAAKKASGRSAVGKRLILWAISAEFPKVNKFLHDLTSQFADTGLLLQTEQGLLLVSTIEPCPGAFVRKAPSGMTTLIY